MGKQFNHEGINNKMMGTETVEPVAQHDISGGQCGAANDKIILPREGEYKKRKQQQPNLCRVIEYICRDNYHRERFKKLSAIIKMSID